MLFRSIVGVSVLISYFVSGGAQDFNMGLYLSLIHICKNLGATLDLSAPVSGAAPAAGMAAAAAALTGLGYSGAEAAAALSGLDPALPTAELIRLALQGIGKRR